jgi:hypothetical protein
MIDVSIRCLGKIKLSRALVNDTNIDGLIEAFAKIGIIPVHVEYIWYSDVFEMTGISSRFREIEPGEMPPLYCVTFSNVNGKIDLERVEEVESEKAYMVSCLHEDWLPEDEMTSDPEDWKPEDETISN